MELLKSYTKVRYEKSTKEEQDAMVDEVFNIYRSKNIFPILYYSDEGVKEEIQKVIDHKVEIKGDRLCLYGYSKLINFMFPNIFEAYNINGYFAIKCDKESGEFKFNDDTYFKMVIRWAIKSHADATPGSVFAGFQQVGVIPTSFPVLNAKALYEKYCPENGVIYDYACGFGSRMLGALSSKKNFTYIGVEPNSKTYENLIRFGNKIEEVTGRRNSFKVMKIGSEDFIANGEIFDFAFSSPPYFNLEHYSDEITQCYNKYPDIYLWLERYVKETIENIYKMLKPGRYYAVNIADFNYSGGVMNYVDVWRDYSKQAGFELVDTLELGVHMHGGNGLRGNMKLKSERIDIFYKN